MSDRMISVLHQCLRLNTNVYFKHISQTVLSQDTQNKSSALINLPTKVLLKLFECLEVLSLLRMRITCKRIQELIDYEYGLSLSFHSKIPQKIRSIANASVAAQFPVTSRKLFISSIPVMITPMNNLTSLNLLVKVSREDSQRRANSNELANALLILVYLPDTPSLKDFGFHLTLASFIRFDEEAEFVLQACILLFFKKRPSISECKAVVQFHSSENDEALALPPGIVSIVENDEINELGLIPRNNAPPNIDRQHVTVTVDRSTGLIVMSIRAVNAPVLSLQDMPDLVFLNLFEFLDKDSLSQMRLVSRRIQELIDFLHGLYLSFDSKRESKERWTALKDKACCSLTLVDIPSNLISRANRALLEYPTRLTSVHLRQVQVKLVHRFLSGVFPSLKNFEYGENKRKVSHSSNDNHNFISSIENAPQLKTPLNNLTSLHLVAKVWKNELRFFSQPQVILTDWTNVLFVLVALPDTPSLRKFHLNLTLQTYVRLKPSNKFFLQACLLEFLKRRSSLLELSVHVLSNTYESETEQPLPQKILSSVCEKYGSSELKEFLRIMSTNEARQKIKAMIRNVGVVLKNLETLDVTFGSETEPTNDMVCFLEHLQNLKTVKVQHCVKYSDQPDEEFEKLGWKLLKPGEFLRGLPLLETVTTLSLKCGVSNSVSLWNSPEWNDPPDFYDLLSEMPRLTNVEIIGLGCSTVELKHPGDIYDDEDIDTPEEDERDPFMLKPFAIYVRQPRLRILKRYDMSPLKRLKKLRLSRIKISVKDFVNLIECSNLEEFKLNVDYVAEGNNLGGEDSGGVSTDLLFRLMTSFRKLNKLKVTGIMTQPSLSPEESYWHWNILKQCGQVKHHPSPRHLQRFYLFSFKF